MYKISCEYTVAAAHRLEGHPRCGRLHGHNYTITVTLKLQNLPKSGMVLDYAVLDHIVKPILELMDHKYWVSQANTEAGDPYAAIAQELGHAFMLGIRESTAELLAEYFQRHVRTSPCLGDYRPEVVVTVRESLKSTATFYEAE